MQSNSNAPVPPTQTQPSPAPVPPQGSFNQPQQLGAPIQATPQQSPVKRPEDPSLGLGIAGLAIGIIFFPLLGFILCLIAYKNSQKAGYSNTVALVGAWINGVLTVLGAIIVAFLLVTLAAASQR